MSSNLKANCYGFSTNHLSLGCRKPKEVGKGKELTITDHKQLTLSDGEKYNEVHIMEINETKP